jgi:hypothetical protein
MKKELKLLYNTRQADNFLDRKRSELRSQLEQLSKKNVKVRGPLLNELSPEVSRS